MAPPTVPVTTTTSRSRRCCRMIQGPFIVMAVLLWSCNAAAVLRGRHGRRNAVSYPVSSSSWDRRRGLHGGEEEEQVPNVPVIESVNQDPIVEMVNETSATVMITEEEELPAKTMNATTNATATPGVPSLINMVPVVINDPPVEGQALETLGERDTERPVDQNHAIMATEEPTRPPRHKTDPPASHSEALEPTRSPRHKTDPPQGETLEPTRPPRHKTDPPDAATEESDDQVDNEGTDDATSPHERDHTDDDALVEPANGHDDDASGNGETQVVKDNDDDKVVVIDVDEESTLEGELADQKKEARLFGGFGFFFAIVAMVFTAHQMSENPDGIYASVCRLIITIAGCVIKLVLMPCRSLLGGRYRSHMPVSTIDSYREPYRGSAHVVELS